MQDSRSSVICKTAGVTALLCAVFFYICATLLGINFSEPTYDLPLRNALQQEFEHQSTPRLAPNTATLKMLWQTPVVHTNAAAFNISLEQFNANLGSLILTEYNKLIAQNKHVSKDSTQRSINALFYEWQTDRGGWSKFENAKEVNTVVALVNRVADNLLRIIGVDEAIVGSRDKKLHAWATVHNDCIMHMRHSHPKAMLSAVYYVKVPEKAGQIVLEDPRGPLPPFDNRLTITPKAGDLLMFPSWLMHMVSPTSGESQRISIAFNVPGGWEPTATIENEFQINIE